MKNSIQKLCALALSAALALGLAPAALAENDGDEPAETLEIIVPLDEDTADTTGENAPSDEAEPSATSVPAGEETPSDLGESGASSQSSVQSQATSKSTATTPKATTKKTTTTTKKTTTKATTTTKKKTTTTTKKTEAPKTVKLKQSVTLYKGESRTLDIVGVKSKATVKSSNVKAVAVSGKKITAKKSGTSTVTVTFKSGKNTYIVNIKVTVKVSSYDKSVSFKATSTPSGMKTASLVMHREVKVGKTYTLSLSGYDSVTFSSSNTKVATVSKKGVVTAKAKGTALIKAKVRAGKESYTFYTKIHAYTDKPAPTVSQSEINTFFGKSGFVGSSIGVGQQLYFNSQGYNFLGHPTMMVRGCYAFHNDGGANGAQYQISYAGVAGPARTVIKRSGVKRVFINMGTNDMMGNADYVYSKYVAYLKGIRDTNPNVPIYIEAMTPIYAGGQKGYLNNAQVNALNAKMQAYCSTQDDMYYIDINTPLKAGTSSLPAAYTSDNYVHLTNAAYKVWTDTVVAYVKAQLIAEQRAKDAVQTYTESKTDTNLKAAKKLVNKLEKGTLKTKLAAKLK